MRKFYVSKNLRNIIKNVLSVLMSSFLFSGLNPFIAKKDPKKDCSRYDIAI